MPDCQHLYITPTLCICRSEIRRRIGSRESLNERRESILRSFSVSDEFEAAARQPFQGQVRVARWQIYKPKNPNLGNFGRLLQWKMLGIFCGHWVCFMALWYILWSFGLFYGTLVYFVVIKSVLLLFGIFFPYWYIAPRKIWQPFQGQVFTLRI
jgi:hypothetical protein